MPSTSFVDGETLSSDKYERINDDLGLDGTGFQKITSFSIRTDDQALLLTTLDGNLYEVTPD